MSTLNNKLKSIWDLSQNISTLCQRLASDNAEIDTGEAALAGLIHAIGALPILIKAEKKPELISSEDSLKLALTDLKPVIGAFILHDWNFPRSLIVSIEKQNDIKKNKGEGVITLADILQVAIAVNGSNDIATLLELPVFGKVGINSEDELEEINQSISDSFS